MIKNCYNKLTNFKYQIEIKNNELNKNIKQIMLNILRKELKGKCFDNIGYIDDVSEITNFEHNYINTVELKSSVICAITSNIIVFYPNINWNIIVKFDNYLQDDLLCSSGPLKIIINFSDIDTSLFFVEDNIIKYNTDGTNLSSKNDTKQRQLSTKEDKLTMNEVNTKLTMNEVNTKLTMNEVNTKRNELSTKENTKHELKEGDFIIIKLNEISIKDNVDKIVGIGYLINIMNDTNIINEYYYNNLWE